MTVVIPNSDEAEAADYLRDAAARAGVEPTGVEVIASTGPAHEIVDSAHARGDLVCMATHGRGRLGELLLGSVSELVIARSLAPVLLVGPDAEVGSAGVWSSPGPSRRLLLGHQRAPAGDRLGVRARGGSPPGARDPARLARR